MSAPKFAPLSRQLFFKREQIKFLREIEASGFGCYRSLIREIDLQCRAIASQIIEDGCVA